MIRRNGVNLKISSFDLSTIMQVFRKWHLVMGNFNSLKMIGMAHFMPESCDLVLDL